MGASVISGCNTAPILELSKHVFNLMPLFIQNFIVVYLTFSVLPGRDAGCNSLFHQTFPEPVGIITAVRQKVFGCGKVIKQLSGPGVVRNMASGQMHEHGPAGAVTDGV